MLFVLRWGDDYVQAVDRDASHGTGEDNVSSHTVDLQLAKVFTMAELLAFAERRFKRWGYTLSNPEKWFPVRIVKVVTSVTRLEEVQ